MPRRSSRVQRGRQRLKPMRDPLPSQNAAVAMPRNVIICRPDAPCRGLFCPASREMRQGVVVIRTCGCDDWRPGWDASHEGKRVEAVGPRPVGAAALGV
ncbi:MAG: hypothetical protein ACK56I_18020, partial [bacterium]